MNAIEGAVYRVVNGTVYYLLSLFCESVTDDTNKLTICFEETLTAARTVLCLVTLSPSQDLLADPAFLRIFWSFTAPCSSLQALRLPVSAAAADHR